MLDSLTKDDFASCQSEVFAVEVDGQSLELELVEAEYIQTRAPREGKRQAFSVVFRGPAEPLLPQGTYPLVHGRLGTLALFIVPIDAGPDGTRYEAVFT